MRRFSILALVAVLVASCATNPPQNGVLSPENQPTADVSQTETGYRLAELQSDNNSPSLMIFLAFSGGGKRSSAFSYGVLEGLRDTPMPGHQGRRLLDEVDLISAVSGGSFTAAYYGLYRDKTFETYRKDFLDEDIEAYIWGTYLLPWHWDWMVSGSLGTNDTMAEVYDTLMFHGAKFSDLEAKGRPLIAVNATDITYGSPFSFVQDHFDLICSDLSSYPVARAVAASNGLPVLFSPITLKNYADQCDGRRPGWVGDWLGDPEVSREHEAARVAAQYLDVKQTEYVHLLDGGISDNLAMRPIISAIMRFNDNSKRFAHTQTVHVRRVLLISVDGQGEADTHWAKQPTVPGIGQIVAAVSGSQIDQYNFETLLLANEQMTRLVEQLKSFRCQHRAELSGEDCADVTGQVIHLSLARIKDPAERKRLLAIPTGLTLAKEDVDQLVASGRQVALTAPEIKAFLAALGAGSPSHATP